MTLFNWLLIYLGVGLLAILLAYNDISRPTRIRKMLAKLPKHEHQNFEKIVFGDLQIIFQIFVVLIGPIVLILLILRELMILLRLLMNPKLKARAKSLHRAGVI